MTTATSEVAEATAAGTPERTRSGATYVPLADIYETEEAIYLVADMPGVGPEGVEVDLEGSTLTITGTPVEAAQDEGDALRLEYEPGGYLRAFSVSDAIQRDGIRAVIKDGVLTLTLPKAAPAQTRRIDVQAG